MFNSVSLEIYKGTWMNIFVNSRGLKRTQLLSLKHLCIEVAKFRTRRLHRNIDHKQGKSKSQGHAYNTFWKQNVLIIEFLLSFPWIKRSIYTFRKDMWYSLPGAASFQNVGWGQGGPHNLILPHVKSSWQWKTIILLYFPSLLLFISKNKRLYPTNFFS